MVVGALAHVMVTTAPTMDTDVMLMGEPPFTGPTAQAIIAKVMTDAPHALTLHRKTVPPQVEAAIMQALQKLPADRFGTAAEFAEALTSTTITGTFAGGNRNHEWTVFVLEPTGGGGGGSSAGAAAHYYRQLQG